MVVPGETATEPEVGDTLPMPLLIDALVAPLIDQDSVEDPTGVIVDGLAERLPLGGGITVIAAWYVALPPALVNVNV